MKLVVQELTVHAPTQVLYELLTDPELFVQWMAEDATLDPRPGGVVRWTHANGDTCSGHYVELLPARRVVRDAQPHANDSALARTGARRST